MNDDGVLVVGGLAVSARRALHALAGPVTTHDVSRAPGHARTWVGKRAIDVVLALVLLVLSLPVFLVLAVVIKVTSPGPVLFRQRRVGRGGDDFPMLKFRTMHADAEERLRSDGALHELFLQECHKIPCRLDPRVTTVGRVLRRLSLDELPQLLNVLAGHMSLVGPRPVERTQLVRDYGEYAWAYVALRPGLTGLWQVSGRSRVHFPERAQLDERYLRTCGAWVDAKILLRTPRAVVTGLVAD